MMVGEATVTLRRGARYIKVQICILKNGDVGKADMLIGNSFMWADHWGACIDCDEELLKIRHADDGKGRLAIPIEWRLNHNKVRTDEAARACFEQRCVLRRKQALQFAELEERTNEESKEEPDDDATARVKLSVATKEKVILLPNQPTVLLCSGTQKGSSAKERNMVWAEEDVASSDFCLHAGIHL